MSNNVFIASSLDGYISDKDGKVDWLPNPSNNDFSYSKFIENIDAIVMGRNTYETVLGFGIDWPYEKHVYVLSNKLEKLDDSLKNKVSLLNGDVNQIIKKIHKDGNKNLYIDGGKTIQRFLEKNLIDEITITTIPILLGDGSRLFDKMDISIKFEHVETNIFENFVQSQYKKI